MSDTQENPLLAHYHALSPEVILQAFEQSTGLYASGRLTPLNSLENRVYELEIELDEPSADPADRFRVVKFYRPGRWSKVQILEEHQFLLDLIERDIPVVAPVTLPDGETLHKLPELDIYYTVFPKRSGRCATEFNPEQAESLGRLLARIHEVGKLRPAEHRLTINPQSYGLNNLQYLIDAQYLPSDVINQYSDLVHEICQISLPWFEQTPIQRIHGDCHLGNLIDRDGQFYWVDFDDMLQGPCIQDLWLIVPGHDDYAKQLWQALISGYDDFSVFDYSSMRLIEPLRALRYIHFSAWIAKRHTEPAFMQAYPMFTHPHYWQGQVQDLQQQLLLIKERAAYA